MKTEVKAYAIVLVKDGNVQKIHPFVGLTIEDVIKQTYNSLTELFHTLLFNEKDIALDREKLRESIVSGFWTSYDIVSLRPMKIMEIKWVETKTGANYRVEVWKDDFSLTLTGETKWKPAQ